MTARSLRSVAAVLAALAGCPAPTWDRGAHVSVENVVAPDFTAVFEVTLPEAFRGPPSVVRRPAAKHADPAVIECVNSVAREARIPPFRVDTFNVEFPFRFSSVL